MPKINRVKTVPDLVTKELIALLSACSILILVSTLFDAPLGGPADPNGVPMENVKAPWIFVGIQQTLRFLPPWLAGIFMPLMAMLLLVALPMLARQRRFGLIIFFGILVAGTILTLWGYLS
jgi:ubiquinol-cytochrome c reductase cytochrome b subunit